MSKRNTDLHFNSTALDFHKCSCTLLKSTCRLLNLKSAVLRRILTPLDFGLISFLDHKKKVFISKGYLSTLAMQQKEGRNKNNRCSQIVNTSMEGKKKYKVETSEKKKVSKMVRKINPKKLS